MKEIFFTVFSKFSDTVHPAVVLEQLFPLIFNTPKLQLFYTAKSLAYKMGRLTETERNRLMKEGLKVAVTTVVSSASCAMFKLASKQALGDNCITENEMVELNDKVDAQMMSMEHSNDIMMRYMNANSNGMEQKLLGRYDAQQSAIVLDAEAARSTADALKRLQAQYKQQHNVDSATEFLTCLLNALPFRTSCPDCGVYIGDMRSNVLDSIVDFSRTQDMLDIVNKARKEHDLPIFDASAFLESADIETIYNGDSGEGFLDSVFPFVTTEDDGRMSILEKREIQALEVIAVASEAFTARWETVTPDSESTLSPIESTETSLHVFLHEIGLEHALDTLEQCGFRSVGVLRALAEEQGSMSAFALHMYERGLKHLKLGHCVELYSALMQQ